MGHLWPSDHICDSQSDHDWWHMIPRLMATLLVCRNTPVHKIGDPVHNESVTSLTIQYFTSVSYDLIYGCGEQNGPCTAEGDVKVPKLYLTKKVWKEMRKGINHGLFFLDLSGYHEWTVWSAMMSYYWEYIFPNVPMISPWMLECIPSIIWCSEQFRRGFSYLCNMGILPRVSCS